MNGFDREIQRPAHLFLRLPVAAQSGANAESIIHAHNQIFESEGRVFFCKFGLPPDKSHIKKLNEQITGGVTTHIFFSLRTGKGVRGYSANLKSVSTDPPLPEHSRLIPKYYQALQPFEHPGQLWLMLESQIGDFDLRALRLRSNKRALLDVISETRTPAMIVELTPTVAAATPPVSRGVRRNSPPMG